MSLDKQSLRQALGHLEQGDWQAAHEIVQQDEESPLACWAHGIVHLIEGDVPNARFFRLNGGDLTGVDAVLAQVGGGLNALIAVGGSPLARQRLPVVWEGTMVWSMSNRPADLLPFVTHSFAALRSCRSLPLC